jgi:hypothetical protein
VSQPGTKRQPRVQKKFRLHALRLHPYCQWCQCPLTPATATTDHLVPLSRGGTNQWENLCLACRPCNQGRMNHLPRAMPSGPCWGQEWPAKVRTPPVDPPSSGFLWVAWTRYPGGRWRRTFRGYCPSKLQRSVDTLMGKSVEVVFLPEGEEPASSSELSTRFHDGR